MKNKISTLLSLFAAFLFSPDTSGLFTQAKAQCQANWNIGTVVGCTVDFINTSIGTNAGTQYSWSFGDGQTSNLQNPSHTYCSSGTYDICLTIITPGTPTCIDSLCLSIADICGLGISSYEQIDILLSVNNPVFSSADIHYSISSSGNIELALFDIVGNKVGVLENETKSAGMHSYLLNTNSFSKGIYFIRLDFEGRIITTRKIIIS